MEILILYQTFQHNNGHQHERKHPAIKESLSHIYITGHVEILNAVNRYGSRVRRFSIKDNFVALKNSLKSLKAWKDGGRYRVDIAE